MTNGSVWDSKLAKLLYGNLTTWTGAFWQPRGGGWPGRCHEVGAGPAAESPGSVSASCASCNGRAVGSFQYFCSKTHKSKHFSEAKHSSPPHQPPHLPHVTSASIIWEHMNESQRSGTEHLYISPSQPASRTRPEVDRSHIDQLTEACVLWRAATHPGRTVQDSRPPPPLVCSSRTAMQ